MGIELVLMLFLVFSVYLLNSFPFYRFSLLVTLSITNFFYCLLSDTVLNVLYQLSSLIILSNI